MGGRKAHRQDQDMRKRIIALLFALAAIAERARVMPAPVRSLALRFLRRAELAAHSYVCWAARECGVSLQWALPDAAKANSDLEAALALAWWLRILAVALRDLPRRALAVRMTRLQWPIAIVRAACAVGLVMDRPAAVDTS